MCRTIQCSNNNLQAYLEATAVKARINIIINITSHQLQMHLGIKKLESIHMHNKHTILLYLVAVEEEEAVTRE